MRNRSRLPRQVETTLSTHFQFEDKQVISRFAVEEENRTANMRTVHNMVVGPCENLFESANELHIVSYIQDPIQSFFGVNDRRVSVRQHEHESSKRVLKTEAFCYPQGVLVFDN